MVWRISKELWDSRNAFFRPRNVNWYFCNTIYDDGDNDAAFAADDDVADDDGDDDSDDDDEDDDNHDGDEDDDDDYENI